MFCAVSFVQNCISLGRSSALAEMAASFTAPKVLLAISSVLTWAATPIKAVSDDDV
jgi:hypothetical protein